MTEKIVERLATILRDVFDDDDIVAKPELTAQDVEGWDSLSNIRLFLAIEKEFGVRFSASEMGALKNVGELTDTIARKQAGK